MECLPNAKKKVQLGSIQSVSIQLPQSMQAKLGSHRIADRHLAAVLQVDDHAAVCSTSAALLVRLLLRRLLLSLLRVWQHSGERLGLAALLPHHQGELESPRPQEAGHQARDHEQAEDVQRHGEAEADLEAC